MSNMLANSMIRRSKQVEASFDEESLIVDLEHLTPEDWIHHYLTQHHYIQGDYHVAPLYAANGVPTAYSDFMSKQCPTRLLERTPYFQKVLSFFECEFSRVRLMRMAPGTVIADHIDQMDVRSEIQLARFHVPIVTNAGVYFGFSGEEVHMAPGECWYVDTALPHAAGNLGEEARIHLVVDCIVNEFINTLVGYNIIENRRKRADEYAHHMKFFQKEWAKNVPQENLNLARRLFRRGVRFLRQGR